MAASLVPRIGGSPIYLDKPIVLIGRHQDCDAVLQTSTKVSRRHCCVARVNEQFVIRDLGSMNGVRVNGARVVEALLCAGDEVAIGDQFFVLNLGEAAAKGLQKKQQGNGHHPPAVAPSAARAVPRSPAPEDLSMEFPVAIPDEEMSYEAPHDAPSDFNPPIPLEEEPPPSREPPAGRAPRVDEPVLKEPIDDIPLKENSDSELDYIRRT